MWRVRRGGNDVALVRVTRRGAGRRLVLPALVVLAVLVGGCAPPGTPVQEIQAARLGVATSNISSACGYAFELTAFGGRHAPGIGAQEAAALAAAHKLAGVYAQSPSDIYQGESVGSIVGDTINLLDECGLPGARRVLQQALARRR